MSLINTLRKPRIFKIALFDLILSIVSMEILFRRLGAKKYVGASLAIPIGIITHYYLGINTQLNNYLGINTQLNNYLGINSI